MKLVILRHLSNHLLKCAAVMLSVLCWLQVNYNKEISCSVCVPLLFDHADSIHTISAPDTVTLQVQGTRTALFGIRRNSSAFHIDARQLGPGEHHVALSRESIFLPEFVSMINYSPCKITLQ